MDCIKGIVLGLAIFYLPAVPARSQPFHQDAVDRTTSPGVEADSPSAGSLPIVLDRTAALTIAGFDRSPGLDSFQRMTGDVHGATGSSLQSSGAPSLSIGTEPVAPFLATADAGTFLGRRNDITRPITDAAVADDPAALLGFSLFDPYHQEYAAQLEGELQFELLAGLTGCCLLVFWAWDQRRWLRRGWRKCQRWLRIPGSGTSRRGGCRPGRGALAGPSARRQACSHSQPELLRISSRA